MRLLLDVSIWPFHALWPSFRQILCSLCLCLVLYSVSFFCCFPRFFRLIMEQCITLTGSCSFLVLEICPKRETWTTSVFAVLFCQPMPLLAWGAPYRLILRSVFCGLCVADGPIVAGNIFKGTAHWHSCQPWGDHAVSLKITGVQTSKYYPSRLGVEAHFIGDIPHAHVSQAIPRRIFGYAEEIEGVPQTVPHARVSSPVPWKRGCDKRF